ncbi:hypothetical protein [Pyruvatibacter sp.]|uniref:hypothetical protein n=1 Tax=Pyruvatibacter sp. TaxID=1981328 RepID=UPI0032EBE722
MDTTDRHELMRQLFVLATERLEDAHTAAVAGQAPDRGPNAYEDHARTLVHHAEDAALFARSVLAAAGRR